MIDNPTAEPTPRPRWSRSPRRRPGRLPLALGVPAGLGVAFLVLPLAGLLIRAPWTSLPQRLTEPGILTALRLSHPDRPGGSPRNTWPATITGIQRHGDNLRIQLAGPIIASADITPAAASHLRLLPGQRVWAAVKATETRAYPTAAPAAVQASPASSA